MDLTEKLLESHKALSRVTTGIFVAVLFFCMYLVQRALSVIASAQVLLFPGGQKQWSYLGLELSFKTLTYLWPLLLGALCLGFSLLVSKQILALSLLKKESPSLASDQLYALDPFLVTPAHAQFRGIHSIYAVVAQAPVVANGFHLLSVLAAVAEFSFSPRFAILATDGVGLLYPAIGVVLSSVFGFWAALQFSKAMRAIRLAYGWTRAAEDDTVKKVA